MMDTLMDRMGVQPILLTIDTMLKFEDDFDGHSDDDVTCKQTQHYKEPTGCIKHIL